MNNEKNEKPILVFWFDSPPRAGAGAFKIVTQNWGSDVHYFIWDELREERISGGWSNADHGNAKITILSQLIDRKKFVSQFFSMNPNAIHIFNGFRSKTSNFLNLYLRFVTKPRVVVWSERPGIYGSRLKMIFKKLYHPLIHRFYRYKYSNKIRALIPLGKRGLEDFSKYGWKRSMMFPFMYDPPMSKTLPNIVKSDNNQLVKFIYIGRFSRSTKGIDIIINTFNKIIIGGWKLSLVGGYGEFKDFTIKWANSNKNIEFLGRWKSNEITEKMSNFDVAIVPSRFDGWNVVVNEALRAGIGVIVSDEAVSHELIEASKAGMIVKAGNLHDFENAIKLVLNKPSIINIWKQNASIYSEKISSDVVGMYLIDVLEYLFISKFVKKPSCPWLK
jgi:glycosyltransferase involved in cell wall biosynthesis